MRADWEDEELSVEALSGSVSELGTPPDCLDDVIARAYSSLCELRARILMLRPREFNHYSAVIEELRSIELPDAAGVLEPEPIGFKVEKRRRRKK